MIHDRGIGDIIVGEPVPESILALEGKTYKALYFDPMKGKVAGRSNDDSNKFFLPAGLKDLKGTAVLTLKKTPSSKKQCDGLLKILFPKIISTA